VRILAVIARRRQGLYGVAATTAMIEEVVDALRDLWLSSRRRTRLRRFWRVLTGRARWTASEASDQATERLSQVPPRGAFQNARIVERRVTCAGPVVLAAACGGVFMKRALGIVAPRHTFASIPPVDAGVSHCRNTSWQRLAWHVGGCSFVADVSSWHSWIRQGVGHSHGAPDTRIEGEHNVAAG
jgi:hypothetical protein